MREQKNGPKKYEHGALWVYIAKELTEKRIVQDFDEEVYVKTVENLVRFIQ